MNRRQQNTEYAKAMRSYTAYCRLQRKADKAGNRRESDRYFDKAMKAYRKAQRAKEREQARAIMADLHPFGLDRLP